MDRAGHDCPRVSQTYDLRLLTMLYFNVPEANEGVGHGNISSSNTETIRQLNIGLVHNVRNEADQWKCSPCRSSGLTCLYVI